MALLIVIIGASLTIYARETSGGSFTTLAGKGMWIVVIGSFLFVLVGLTRKKDS